MNTQHLTAIARAMDIKFSVNGIQISYEEVFSDIGYFPGIAKRADQLCSLCLGYGLGTKFEEEKNSKLGSRVKFDDSTPAVLRYLCIADVMNEIKQNSSSNGLTSLDELLYD